MKEELDVNEENYSIKEISLSLCPRQITKLLFNVLLILFLANTVLICARIFLDSENWFPEDTLFAKIEYTLVGFFDFNNENNLPAFFSALLLIFCSLILFLIYRKAADNKSAAPDRSWLLLSIIFLYMGIDESVQIHEASIGPVRSMLPESAVTYFHYAWVIPYSFLGVLGILVLMPFLSGLSRRTRNLFALSGLIFISGAVGMEVIGGYYAAVEGTGNLSYKLSYTIEELLEMSGVILFIYSLLDYIRGQKLNFVFIP